MIGKAIYSLIIDTENGVGDTIGTRCFPMTAPQGSEYPLVTYEPSPPQPSDTKHGPSTLDVQPAEVVIYSRRFSEAEEIASTLRAMFDRYSGTVATVAIQSVQFQNQSYEHYPEIELYAIVQQYQFRLPRDLSVVITGSPLEELNLGRLADVTIDDPIDRQTLAYDEATGQWINDGAGSISIPIFNNLNEEIVAGRPLSAIGAQGDRISVEPYQTAYGALRFVGIAGENIPARSNGHATVYGEIRGLDTSNFPVGTLLYPLEGINENFYPFGLFSWVEGTNANPLVCAIVTRQQQNTGRIFVRMWSPGYRNNLNRMDDVVISNPFQGALLRYDSDQGDWRVPPQTSKTILEAATETVEIYYYSITTDTQQFRSAQSDTPSEGNKIVRKIYYSTTAQEDIDSGTWTLLETLDDNATYADLVDAFEDQLKTSPGGDTPISIKTTWEDVAAFTGLLDTYSGAAAAYSLRLLDTDYTGSAIRVRRASDNAEQDIGFDGNGDLDTTSLATFCESNLYTSDFSINEDGLAASGATLTGNIDAFGLSDTLRFTVSATTGVKFITLPALVIGEQYRLSLKLYNPNTNTVVTGVRISNPNYANVLGASITTTNSWVNVNRVFTATSTDLRIFAEPFSIAGNGTDVIYFKDIQITQVTDGFVKTWYDQSGNANDATQTTTGRQPKIYDSATGVNLVNGKPSILAQTQSVFQSLSHAFSDTSTVFATAQVDTTTSILMQFNTSYILAAQSGSTSPDSNMSVSYYKNGAAYNPANRGEVFSDFDATQNLVSAIVTTTGFTSFAIGYPIVPTFTTYSLGEIVIYDSDQSANRTGIESNINTYYSIYP